MIECTRSWGYTHYFFSIICQKPVNFEENTIGVHFKIKISGLKNDRINAGSINFPFYKVSIYSARKKIVAFLLFIAGFTVAVILYYSSYFLFDSHIANQHGTIVPNGKTVLL